MIELPFRPNGEIFKKPPLLRFLVVCAPQNDKIQSLEINDAIKVSNQEKKKGKVTCRLSPFRLRPTK